MSRYMEGWVGRLRRRAAALAVLALLGPGAGAASADVLHATPQTLGDVFGRAGAGDTILLAGGDYGVFEGGLKSGMVTLKPEPGATPLMGLDFTPAANITVDGVTIGDMNLAGAESRNVTIRNSRFDKAQAVVRTADLSDADIVFDHDSFVGFDECPGCAEGRLTLVGRGDGPSGVTVSNSLFKDGNSDGIQNGADGTTIVNNVFTGIHQVDPVEGVHADAVQLLGSARSVIRGNFFDDVATGVMAADGADHELIEDNVFVVTGSAAAVTLKSDNGSVVRHNTLADGKCDFDLACGQVYVGFKEGQDPPASSTGTVVRDNILSAICTCEGNVVNPDFDFNLQAHPRDPIGPSDLVGSPTFVGGAAPSTLPGFALADDSMGRSSADDGSDMGARIPPVAPPVGPEEPVNADPVCKDVDLGSASHGTAASGRADCTDADGDTLTYTAAGDEPAHGTATVSAGGALRYEPQPGFVGTDSFHYQASDGHGGLSAVKAVTVTITDAAPACDAQPDGPRPVVAGEAKDLVTACTDPDGEPLSAVLVAGPAHGTLGAASVTASGVSFPYTADAAYSGSDAFTFKVTDGALESAVYTVAVAVNQRPVCAAVPDVQVPAHAAKTIQLSCTDADGPSPLSYVKVSDPAHGTLGEISPGGLVTYTPAGDYAGPDAFQVKAADGRDESAVRTVALVVAGNAVPACDAVQADVAHATLTVVDLHCTDADGDALTLAKASDPAHGTVSVSGSVAEYVPASDYAGADSFTYVARDGHGGESAPATVTLQVAPGPPHVLTLTLGSPTPFAPFVPGAAKDYLATVTADVSSSAQSTALSVADPDAARPGRLVNAAYALASPLRANAGGGAFQAVRGAGDPVTLLTFDHPVTHDAVELGFQQTIDATEPLRTGAYGKTLTFTLSTTAP